MKQCLWCVFLILILEFFKFSFLSFCLFSQHLPFGLYNIFIGIESIIVTPCHNFPSSHPVCPPLHTPFLCWHIPGLPVYWGLPCPCCTFTWHCQFSVKRFNVHMHFRTFWCNLLGVVGILSSCFECTYWHSVCYLLSIGCNSFSLPMWVDFSLGQPEGRELAFLHLSFFFHFSPSEVVLMKYKLFLWNKISKKLKL